MRKAILLLGLLFCSKISFAVSGSGSLAFTTDSVQVSVTSTTVKQIMTRDSYITNTYLINPSSWTSLCVSTYAASVAVSTTTSPSIPPNTSFILGANGFPWIGSLWAIVCNGPGQTTSATQTISVIRTK